MNVTAPKDRPRTWRRTRKCYIYTYICTYIHRNVHIYTYTHVCIHIHMNVTATKDRPRRWPVGQGSAGLGRFLEKGASFSGAKVAKQDFAEDRCTQRHLLYVCIRLCVRAHA